MTTDEPGAPFDPATWTWDQIVRAHRGPVYRHAYRLTRNRYDAEDLTQDVFVRVFHALPTYRPGGSFPGWLHRITTNLFRDGLRRGRRLRVDVPPHFRSAVLLRDVHGLPYDQVADILGIKVGTVRSRLHRGRSQLRPALAHRRRHRAGTPQPDRRAAGSRWLVASHP